MMRDDLRDALNRFQTHTLEALLALADLEEAGLDREILLPETGPDRRIAALNREIEIEIEREIVLQHLADIEPPLRISLD
jgi:hypothetical protein